MEEFPPAPAAPFNSSSEGGATGNLTNTLYPYQNYPPYRAEMFGVNYSSAAASMTGAQQQRHQFEPLRNHTYAAAAASFRPQPQDESDAASRTSGQSSRSKGSCDP